MTSQKYHLPVRPYSPIDALNRRAAALGSIGYAQAAQGANYNGHHVTVSWNSYRGYYIAQYFWAERRVLRRGNAVDCVAAAVAEYERGAVGSSVSVDVLESDLRDVLQAFPQLTSGDVDFTPASWHTWRHECAASAARDSANPRVLVMVFDWQLMQAAESREAYETALKTKHGRIYT